MLLINICVRFIHTITGSETGEQPIETGGGILADDMGLGKTLTMLSAIIRTAGEANSFGTCSQKDATQVSENILIPSRATLVVVPSPCKTPYSISLYFEANSNSAS